MIVIELLALLMTVGSLWWLSRPAPVGEGVHWVQLESVRMRLVAQLRELDFDQADRRVDEGVAANERRRLEFELAQVLKQMDGAARATDISRQSARSPVLVALLAVFVFATAGTLYVLQSRAWLKQASAPVVATQGAQPIPPFVYQMVARLEGHLRRHPDDLNGWMQLARSYGVLGHPQKARQAYEQAYRLAPRNELVLSTYAWALYSSNPTKTTGRVAQLYQQLYRVDPKRQDALWFLGLQAYQQGHMHRTLGYWNTLLRLIPPQNPAAKGVQDAIAHVQQALHDKSGALKKPD